ncbi:MAG: 6-pyruvoyl-tetrahydropterin synthase-related protein [Candidatus Latescibacterota bacterium]|jgi:hypothetical protein
MGERLPRAAACLLALLVALLWLHQAVTMVKFKALKAAGYISPSLFWQDVQEHVGLGTADWGLALLLLFVALALLVLELRWLQLTHFYAYLIQSDRRALIFLTIFGIVCVRYYFAPGMYWGGDASAHLAYAHLAARSLAVGEWPLWTNFLGSGTPYLQFYGFLFFCYVAALDLLCRDFYWAVKFALASAHIVSGLGMYCFVRLACRQRGAGLVAALVYMLSFWHAQQVLVMGRYPLSLFYALLPWVFYGIECVLYTRETGRRIAQIMWGGIALGLLAWVHPGYAFWGTCFAGLYSLLRLGQQRAGRRETFWALLALFVVGILVGSVQTLPMWLERSYTVLRESMVLTGVPDPNWRHLLYWSNHMLHAIPLPLEYAHWYGGYIGVSVCALVVAVVYCIGRWRHMSGTMPVLFFSLVVALFLVFAYRWSGLQALPPVRAMNAARFLLFVVFFASALAGAVAPLLAGLLRRRRQGMALVIIILCIDLLPTTFLDINTTPSGQQDEMLDEVAAEAAAYGDNMPPGRTIVTVGGMHPYLAFSWTYFKTETPLAQADPGNLLPASNLFANPFGHFLNRALAQIANGVGEEIKSSQVLRAGVKLLNVRNVLAAQEDGTTSWLTFGGQSPVLVAPRVAAYKRSRLKQVFNEEEIERLLWKPTGMSRLQVLEQVYPIVGLINEMGVSPRGSSAERFLLADYAGQGDLGTHPAVEVIAHRLLNQRVELEVDVSERAYARLAYAWYPHLRVEVDGDRVESWSTVGGFICLPLEAGRHAITLVPELSPLRRSLWALCALLFFIALGASWRVRWSV